MNSPNLEILAPCGSYEILMTAINAGADACYIGGSRFGARAYAQNISNSDIGQAIDYAHIHGTKLYLTVNTLIKEDELKDAYDYISLCYEAGIDAFIVQDLGLFKLIKEHFPDVHIHCSTQMNITSYHAAAAMKALGATRVVTAREMSLDEIKLIKEHVDIEVETFVHGAMCYSYSGQCLMSSLAGGRSGNRGRCAQPCRKCYDGRYLLSMKDMCTLEILPDIIDAGIDSLKIEGRMKNEYYVASAVAAYKELSEDCLNGRFDIDKARAYKFKLANIYNRGGFTQGYFFMHNSPDMISMDRPNNQGVKVGKVKAAKDGKVLIELSEDIYKGDVLELSLNDKVINIKNRDDHISDIVEITSGVDATRGSKVWLAAPKTRDIRLNRDVMRTRCNHILDEFLEGKSNFRKLPVDIIFTGKKGCRPSVEVALDIGDEHFTATSYGPDLVEQANNRELDIEDIRHKLGQLGNTEFSAGEIRIDADKDAFIPASLIKLLRRGAIEDIEESIKGFYKRNAIDDFRNIETDVAADYKLNSSSTDDSKSAPGHDDGKIDRPTKLKVGVKNLSQLSAVLDYDRIYGIYMDRALYLIMVGTELYEIIKARGIKVYIELPYVITGAFDLDRYLQDIDCDGIYIRNIDGFFSKKAYNKDIICGAGLYAYNSIAGGFISENRPEGVERVTFELPKELNLTELNRLSEAEYLASKRKNSKDIKDVIDREFVVYEYQQVMLANNCAIKDKKGCSKSNEVMKLTDDKSNSFYAASICDECINVIYNGLPFMIFDRADIINRIKDITYHRINFTIEDEAMVRRIMDSYLGMDKSLQEIAHTTGHIKRGVE